MFKSGHTFCVAELSLDLAEKLLSQVASFHATGYHFLAQNQTFVEEHPNMSFPGWLLASSPEWQAKNDANAESQIAIIRDTIRECCSELAPDCANLVARIEKFLPKSTTLVRKQLGASPTSFNTLIHNDIHMNNVMYT